MNEDLFSSSFIQNPYLAYSKLRKMDSVHYVHFPDGERDWLVTDFEDGAAVLKDAGFIKDYSKLYGGRMGEMSVFTQNMLFSDLPKHKRLRGLAQKAFMPKMISGMRGGIQKLTDELLDAIERKGKEPSISSMT